MPKPVSPDARLAAVVLGVLEDLIRGAGVMTLPRLLELTMDAMIQLAGAQRGFLVLKEGERLVFAVARDFQRIEVEDEAGQVSYTIVKQAASTKQVVRSANVPLDDRFNKAGSVRGIGIQAVLCCPLVALSGAVQGVVYLDDLRSPGGFSQEEDEQMLMVFANHAATAIENSRLQERVGQQDSQLATLEKLRTEFISALGHELRTPLTTVRTALDLLAHAPDERARTELVQTARRGLERFVLVVTGLLNFTSEEMAAALHQEQLVPVYLYPLFQTVMESYRPKAADKGLEIQMFLPPELICQAVPTRLERALHSVLDNAVQYTDRGTITVRGSAWRPQSGTPIPAIVLDGGNSFVRIQVEDTGRGIAAADLPHVCERFYRGEGQRAGGAHHEAASGLGLGLATAKRDIEAQQGALLIESQVNVGTTVSMFLRAADVVPPKR